MKLLFITEISPFPAYGGEKIRTAGLLGIFESLSLQTYAIIGKTDDQTWKGKFNHITFRDFAFSRSGKGRWKEARASFRKEKDLERLIRQSIKDFQPDVAYIDYYFYGQYIPLFRKSGIPVIYGTHNAQSKLFLQRPAVSLKNLISNLAEYLIYRMHELIYFRQADALIAVSGQDMAFYRKFIPASRLLLIPNFIPAAEYEPYQIPSQEKENYIIMSGNFNAYQNAAGLRWFLEEVWDQDLSSFTRLLVCGNHSAEILQQINQNESHKNVEALGIVSDIKGHIARAKAAIVPLLHGSGTRLKCIEAMALKTQLISTSKGAEGIEHGGSVMIADTAEAFRNSLHRVLSGQSDFCEKAYAAFLSAYSLEPNASVFRNLLNNLVRL